MQTNKLRLKHYLLRGGKNYFADSNRTLSVCVCDWTVHSHGWLRRPINTLFSRFVKSCAKFQNFILHVTNTETEIKVLATKKVL